METIYLLIPLSLVFLVMAVWLFFWAVRSEQYDDLQGPAHRIILDDRERERERHDSARKRAAAEKLPTVQKQPPADPEQPQ